MKKITKISRGIIVICALIALAYMFQIIYLNEIERLFVGILAIVASVINNKSTSKNKQN